MRAVKPIAKHDEGTPQCMNFMKLQNVTFSILILFSRFVLADEKMSLDVFLKRAQEQNIDLKVETIKVDSAEAKSVGIPLPPPMIGLNKMREENGHEANGYEISQSIPFPTKLSSDHSARKLEAQAQVEMSEGKRKEILATGKLLYFMLWQGQERISLLEEKKNILQNHIQLARSSARSDSSAAVHLLRAESDLDLLENEILTERQKLAEQLSDAAIFLNSDSKNFKMVASEPSLSTYPTLNDTENTYQLKALKYNLEVAKSRESEANSAWLPDFNLRYKKMEASSMSDEYSEFMIGITLPFVFFWEPYNLSRAAGAQRMTAEYELIKQTRTIEAEKNRLVSRAESLKKQIENLKTKLLPRAERRIRLVRNLAPRDMDTLQDHRETLEAFSDLKMKILDLRIDYETTVANLEKYARKKEMAP